mgnify:CR=1 FL=1
MNFEAAFFKLLGHEGGYSNHPDDPGGETMWGITKEVAKENGYTGPMKSLPVETAQAIYKRQYWLAVRAPELPDGVDYLVFDGAVNSGVKQSALWLQRACGATADGIIGPRTIEAAHQMDPQALKMRLLAQRLRFMASLHNWPAFGRGWARRICDLLEA